MIAFTGKKLFAASALLLASVLGGVRLTAQCTYYVSTSGSDSNPGTSVASAFQTLQYAHDFIKLYPATSGLGTRPINVCAESGDYYANDSASASGTTPPGSSNSVLNISLAGGPAAEVTFEPDQGAYVNLHQTGWNGIAVSPGATYDSQGNATVSTPSYVTVQGFVITGQGWTVYGDSNLSDIATSRYADPAYESTLTSGWAFYDGNCIGVGGVYPGTTDTNHPYAGIPHHITIANNQVYACGGGGIGTSQADYIQITGNTVVNCAWYSIYGTSAISLLDSVDIDNVTTEKSFVTNNWVTANYEQVQWVGAYPAPAITDGEGIIIDTNLNSDGTQNPHFTNGVMIPPYGGRTLIANNVIWNNGSSAIEVFESEHVDVEGNSTYGNVFYQWQAKAFQGRGELSVSYASDVSVTNNVFESALPSNGFNATSYPVSGNILVTKDGNGNLQNGWAWFENNVYYGGAGNTAAAFYNGGDSDPTSAETAPSGIPYFYEGVGELLNLNPGYVSTTTSGWPNRVDLRVTNSAAAANGCVNSGAVCDAPVLDILGYARTAPSYASGAYATTAH